MNHSCLDSRLGVMSPMATSKNMASRKFYLECHLPEDDVERAEIFGCHQIFPFCLGHLYPVTRGNYMWQLLAEIVYSGNPYWQHMYIKVLNNIIGPIKKDFDYF